MHSPDKRQIALAEASAGMVLAEPLLDERGGMLLPQGSTLSDSSLAALRRRGVEQCWIEQAADPELAARERARRLARLAHLFRHSGSAEAGPILLQLLRIYREEQP